MPDEEICPTGFPRQMCAVCRARLSPKEAPDGSVVYIHGTWADHEARPVNEVAEDRILICDFCLEPHPTWDFPCGPMRRAYGTVETAVMSVGDWAACDTCKELVVSDNYEELVERIANGRTGLDPETSEMLEKSPALAVVVRITLMEQMMDFKKSRKGPPIPVAEAQWVAAKLATMFGEDNASVPYHMPSPHQEDPR